MLQPEIGGKLKFQIANGSKFFGFLSIIGGSLFQFTIGILFTLGNLIPYFATYGASAEIALSNHPLSNSELQLIYNNQIALTNWIYFVFILAMASGMYLGGYLEINLGITKALIISSFCMSFGYGSTFFALTYGDSHGVGLSILSLGVLGGLGTGLGYPLLMVIGIRWFPSKPGLIGSLCQGVIACGGLIFILLQGKFVNPSNAKFSAEHGLIGYADITPRIPSMFMYIGIIMAGMQIISVVCISNPPWFRDGINSGGVHAAHSHKSVKKEKYPLSVEHALKFSAFWILFFISFFYCLVSTVALLQWKVYAVNYLRLLNDEYLSVIGGLSVFVMGCGRIFWGLFFDWSGSSLPITLSIMSMIVTVFIVTWPICVYLPKVLFAIWMFVIWFNVNGVFAVFPSVICSVFGVKYVGSILRCLALGEVVAVLFVVGISPDLGKWFGGWVGYFVLIGAFGLCSVVLPNFFNGSIDRKQYLWSLKAGSQAENKRLMNASDVISNVSNNYATFVAENSVTSGETQE